MVITVIIEIKKQIIFNVTHTWESEANTFILELSLPLEWKGKFARCRRRFGLLQIYTPPDSAVRFFLPSTSECRKLRTIKKTRVSVHLNIAGPHLNQNAQDIFNIWNYANAYIKHINSMEPIGNQTLSFLWTCNIYIC